VHWDAYLTGKTRVGLRPLLCGLPGLEITQVDDGWPAVVVAESATPASAGTTPWPSMIKGERIDLQPWPARTGARRAITACIGWYNGTRRVRQSGATSDAGSQPPVKVRRADGPAGSAAPA
jgi:hypothetical protein